MHKKKYTPKMDIVENYTLKLLLCIMQVYEKKLIIIMFRKTHNKYIKSKTEKQRPCSQYFKFLHCKQRCLKFRLIQDRKNI